MHIQYDDNRATRGDSFPDYFFLEKKILDYKQNYSLRNGPSKFVFGGGGGGVFIISII